MAVKQNCVAQPTRAFGARVIIPGKLPVECFDRTPSICVHLAFGWGEIPTHYKRSFAQDLSLGEALFSRPQVLFCKKSE